MEGHASSTEGGSNGYEWREHRSLFHREVDVRSVPGSLTTSIAFEGNCLCPARAAYEGREHRVFIHREVEERRVHVLNTFDSQHVQNRL